MSGAERPSLRDRKVNSAATAEKRERKQLEKNIMLYKKSEGIVIHNVNLYMFGESGTDCAAFFEI